MDKGEFEMLYRSLSKGVFNIALRMTGSFEEAKDIVQEVFMKVWKHRKSFRGEAKPSTWIYRIALNTSISHLRKLKRRGVSLEEINWVGHTDPPDPRIWRVERAILKLPEGEREVFLLHDVEGFTHREIGDILGISEGTSKSQLHKARKKLREILKGEI
jgi:RNA polymerase sigma-70 factor (ECF subfamily)